MPYRKHPIVTSEIYHIFNRSVGNQPIFTNKKEFLRALDVLRFYNHNNLQFRYSFFDRLEKEEKLKKIKDLDLNHPKIVDLYSYCLIPNHFHLLGKELIFSGISTLITNFQNSYAKYFNIKTDRHGALFQSQFKAVRIETDEQLLHVCRYIHLNPYSPFLINRIEDISAYPWSSYKNYLNRKDDDNSLINKEFLLNYFSSINAFRQFTLDQADYQRKLKELKYFTLETD